MIGLAHQLILCLLAISVSLLGMLQSTGLMLTLFVLGSLSAVSGVYSLYRLYTTSRIFDSLVNRAIRRAIESQTGPGDGVDESISRGPGTCSEADEGWNSG